MGRTEVGHVITHRAFLILPFKGRTEVGHVITHRAFLILPFKGRTEVGMGFYSRAIKLKFPPPLSEFVFAR